MDHTMLFTRWMDSSIKMAMLCAAKFVCLVYLCLLINVCASYKEHSLEEEVICHPLQKRGKIKLTNDEDSAVIVKSNHKFDSWYVTGDMICKFVIKAEKGNGLFAAIQDISFRTNGSKCIDYVEFKRKDGVSTQKFCGRGSRRDWVLDPEVDNLYQPAVDQYAEYDSKGEIETKIFVSKEHLHPDERLDLTIVYTPYKNCDKVDRNKYVTTGKFTCIWKGYLCDGYRNCPVSTCSDEIGCSNDSNSVGTKVTVGAVTTIFLCFLLFIMCLWTCRKHKKLCWSSDCAGPIVTQPRPGSMQHETGDTIGRSAVPTAPMLDEVLPSPVQDKDLPPTYDSLFPSQSNTTAT